MNGFFIIYASYSDRTPNLLQALLGNIVIVMAIPFNKLHVGDKRNYKQFVPMLCIFLLVASTVISLVPTFQQLAGGDQELSFKGDAGAAWPFVFLIGLFFSAWYPVVQCLVLRRLQDIREAAENAKFGGEENKAEMDVSLLPDHDVSRSTFRENSVGENLHCLAWSCTFLTMWFLLFFWVDLLPWFGSSKSFGELDDNLNLGLSRSFWPWVDGKTNMTFWYGFFFNFAYILSFYTSLPLTSESAVYTNVVNALNPAVVASFWFLFPHLNDSADRSPLWSVLPPLFFSFVAVILWKRWERSEDERLDPSSEQDDNAVLIDRTVSTPMTKNKQNAAQILSVNEAIGTKAGKRDATAKRYTTAPV
jgi:hypothetical protein